MTIVILNIRIFMMMMIINEPVARAVASWKQQKEEREWRSLERVSNLQNRKLGSSYEIKSIKLISNLPD